jgi:hypothetical protein
MTGQKLPIRDNWKSAPEVIAQRDEPLTGVRLGKIVGLDLVVEDIEALGVSARKKRPHVGMLNAPSGSGKSALMQYAEARINSKSGKVLALAVTFNHRTDGDDRLVITPEQGLALRIAERFLCESGSFHHFRSAWLEDPQLKSLPLPMLLAAIATILPTRVVMVLVDEPGLAGHIDRCHPGHMSEVAEAVVEATAASRGLVSNVEESTTDLVADRVRFLFSSLTPVYDDGALAQETASGSDIVWITVPPAGALASRVLRELVKAKLHGLRERMPRAHFDLSVGLLLALASGHWSTLDKLVDRVQPPDFGRGWLRTVYQANVRDVLVATEPISRDPQMAQAAFGALIAHTVLGISSMPDTKIEGHSLIELASFRVILNAISATQAKFNALVPRLSLLDVRSWCLQNAKVSQLAQAVLGVLQSAGNDPSDPEAAAEGSGIAFENTLAYFLVAKFIAWRDSDKTTVSRELAALHQESDGLRTLFPGHVVVHGNPPRVLLCRDVVPRVVRIEGKGGFRAPKPQRKNSKTTQEWETNLASWRERCLSTPLAIDVALAAPCCVQPGAKNQAHSDVLVLTQVAKKVKEEEQGTSDEQLERKQAANEKGVPGAIFVQNKFSDGKSNNPLRVVTVKESLDKLLLERGVLFFETEEEAAKQRGRADNQIASLGIQEENVVLCFSVLRDVSPAFSKFADEVAAHAKKTGFKGVLVVANGQRGGALLYGDSFKHLALVHSSVHRN